MSQEAIKRRTIKAFGRKLREERTKCGISQVTLALRMEFNSTYISNMERGKNDVKISTVARLAKGLNMSVSDLMDF